MERQQVLYIEKELDVEGENSSRHPLAVLPFKSGAYPDSPIGEITLEIGPSDAKVGQKVIIINEILKTVKRRTQSSGGRHARRSLMIVNGYVPRRVVKLSINDEVGIASGTEIKQRLSSTETIVFRRGIDVIN